MANPITEPNNDNLRLSLPSTTELGKKLVGVATESTSRIIPESPRKVAATAHDSDDVGLTTPVNNKPNKRRNGTIRRSISSLPVGKASMHQFIQPIDATTIVSPFSTCSSNHNNSSSCRSLSPKVIEISPKLKDRIAMFNSSSSSSSSIKMNKKISRNALSVSLHGDKTSTSLSSSRPRKYKSCFKDNDNVRLSLPEDLESSFSDSMSKMSLQDRISIFNDTARPAGGGGGGKPLNAYMLYHLDDNDVSLSPTSSTVCCQGNNARGYSDSVLPSSSRTTSRTNGSRLEISWPPPTASQLEKIPSCRFHDSFDDLMGKEIVKTGRSSFEPPKALTNDSEKNHTLTPTRPRTTRKRGSKSFDSARKHLQKQQLYHHELTGGEDVTETTFCGEETSISNNHYNDSSVWTGQWGFDQGCEEDTSSSFGEAWGSFTNSATNREEDADQDDDFDAIEANSTANWIYGEGENEVDEYGEWGAESGTAEETKDTEAINCKWGYDAGEVEAEQGESEWGADCYTAQEAKDHEENKLEASEGVNGQWGYGTGDDIDEVEADNSKWGHQTSISEESLPEDSKQKDSSNGQFQWIYGEGDTVDTEDSEWTSDGGRICTDQSKVLEYRDKTETSASKVDTSSPSQASSSSSTPLMTTSNNGILEHPTFVSIKPLIRGTTDDYMSRKRHYRVRTKYVGRHNRAKDGIIQAMLKK